MSSEALDSYGPYVAQVMVQIVYALMNIIIKVALDDGLNHYVFVTYRQLVATLAISPVAYFVERKDRPPLTFKATIHIFLLGLVGITINQNLYFAGLNYTSSTFASATTNMIPVATFILAFFLRMEDVNIKKIRGLAKVVGTAICVGGALIMTLYNGTQLLRSSFWLQQWQLLGSTWALGAILLFASAFAWSVWLTYQAWVIPCYPAQLSLTAIMCFVATFQSAAVALILNHDASEWKIGWNIQLLSYVYTGLTCSAFAFFIQSWCIKRKGPVFSSAFNPLATVIVAILQTVCLHESLHLGSVVGGVLVIMGLYFVLWGKAEDKKDQLIGSRRSSGLEQVEDVVVTVREPLINEHHS
ncbi:WAT1-related protein At1g21890-like [Nymphaea colorata]|nr:WAT1-related protein At1g21890-like [Nymphaea colorata]